MSAVTLITDGSPAAAALATWLRRRGVDAVLQEEWNPASASSLATSARFAPGQRPVVVSASVPGPARAAAEVAAGWLAPMAPIDARALGAIRIEEEIRRQAPGWEALQELVLALGPAGTRVRTGRRGRPVGSNPLRGAGFDVVTALLLEPQRSFTERELAESTERMPSGVHRVLVELERRGLVTRQRGATRSEAPMALLQALLADWRARVGQRRAAVGYAMPRGDPAAALARAARKAGSPWALAGSSAIEGDLRIAGDPVFAYFSGEERDLLGAGFVAAQRLPDLVVWPVIEPGLLRGLRKIGRHPATSQVVTYLDLQLGGDPRHARAAAGIARSLLGERSA